MRLAPVLDLRDLTVAYDTYAGLAPAIRDISITIASGEARGIVGESGSGKSTLAGAVLDLLGPGGSVTAGSIIFDGRDLRQMSKAERRSLLGRRIGSVFQDPFTSLNPSMRIGAQIAEPLVQHLRMSTRAAEARAAELLSELGIARVRDVAAAFPHQLSGGMKQRALIAMALSCEPSLIILDEPTTALDVTIEAQILDLLADLRARHRVSLMFISHNLAVVRRLCDTVSVLYAGEVVEEGNVETLFAQPSHPYTKGLLASLPIISRERGPGRLSSIPGGLPNPMELAEGCIFAPRCPFAEPACRSERQTPIQASSSAWARCRRVLEIGDRPWPRTESEAIEAPRDVSRPLVEVSDLIKTYRVGTTWDRLKPTRGSDGRLHLATPRKLHAVDRVSIDIREGEILGLVGESGCGKTTLGRCIIRLIEPSGGKVKFDGRDILALEGRQLRPVRRDAQIIFQNPDSSLNPRMRVADIVARPLELFSLVDASRIPARVAELLELVRLPASFGQRYPHQLSGGEKQRVGIARALASQPRFIVCDEAVSALDVSVQAAIVNLLADLRAELKLTLLFISHDISVVAHLADRIAVMYQGRVCEIGPTRAILHPPYHPYTQALLSAAPQVVAQAGSTGRIRLTGEVAEVAASTARCPFHVRCPMKLGAVCDSQTPPWLEAAPGHRIACHHTIKTLRTMPSIVPPEGQSGGHDVARTACAGRTP